jgi:membrane fusion protein (multidrug efflux system)
MRSSRTASRSGLGPALFTLLAVGAAGCARAEASIKKPSETPTISVTTTDVAERAVPKLLTVTGTLVGNRESEVAADAAGRVIDTRVERGAVVAQGAVLARLDARTAALSRSEAFAQAAAARVQKDTAELDCQRAERLFRENAISRAELDRTRASCQSSDHSTAAAVARQYMAEKNIADATIRAPFAGMVVERDVSLGEYVTAGKRIATIVELDPLRLELTVPEIASTAIRVGSPVEFQLKAFPNERFSAKVRYVGPVLRRATRDLVVEALVENPERRLMPGMFAEAQLRLGEQRLPMVPKSALSGTEPSLRAFAVVNGVIEERVVLAGSSDGNEVAILKGLRAGDRIVTHPDKSVVDGAKIGTPAQKPAQ